MSPTFLQLQREIVSSLRGLDPTQTQLRPPADSSRWSIQQIVEHLLLTYSTTETAINTRLAKRAPTRTRSTLRQRVRQYAVTRCGYFPSGREAPAMVAPQPTLHLLSGEDLAHATAEHLAQLDLLLAEADKLFGSSSQFASHAVLGPLNTGQWRMFQLVHGRHHLKQIAAIRKTHNLQ